MTDERPDLRGGLGNRYRVEKTQDPTGKHADCRYFVLDPRHDPIAGIALRAYADHPDTPEALRLDLLGWIGYCDRGPCSNVLGHDGRCER